MAFLSPLTRKSGFDNSSNDVFSLLQTDVNRLFNKFLKDDLTGESIASQKFWSPHVALKETGNEYILTLDLPGTDKKEAHISFEDNVLTIKGERKDESKKEGEHHHWNERKYGYFERSFSFPQTMVDETKITAEMKNGELKVTLPKRAEAKKEHRTIQIN